MPVRIMFDIEAEAIPQILKLMAPYAQGPIILGYPEEAADPPAIDARKTRGNAEAKQEATTSPGPGRKPLSNSPSVHALEILREAGGKGMAPKEFHTAMIARGFDRKRSHNAAFFVRKAGKIRKSASGRLYITREGNAAQ